MTSNSKSWVVVCLGVVASVVVACLGVVASAFVVSPALALNENAVPHDGAGITKRRCLDDSPNEGDLCNDDADCAPGTCFPYNIIDLTVNLTGLSRGRAGHPDRRWSCRSLKGSFHRGLRRAV